MRPNVLQICALLVSFIAPGLASRLPDRLVERHVHRYNQVRLHSAIGWVTPAYKLAGREDAIWARRDRRLEAAREARRQRRLCA